MSRAVTIETGEWAGWRNWPHDTFESSVGPFYFRKDDARGVICAFRAEPRHMNGGGFMHGGCFMTFADFCVFSIAEDVLGDGHAVTVNLSADFLGRGEVGDFMEATGEVTRAGKRILYVRGLVTANGRPALSYSSVITRVGDRNPA
jgi:acyl-coenzyme A thioesterase PaaI-like protein